MQEIKNSGKMMTLKSDIEGLAQAIKNVEQELDETLHNSIVKASSLVTLNNSIREIQFTCRVVEEYIQVGRTRDAKPLIIKLSRQICNLESQITREIQKSMLKATEAMAEAEGGILMMYSVGRLKKTFDEMSWSQ